MLGWVDGHKRVDVIGKSANWFCIEFGPAKRPGFVLFVDEVQD